MTTPRPERVQEALRQEISNIVQQELRDPRLGFITITKVEITKDLRNANVFFSVLGTDKEKKRALHALVSAKGYVKSFISERVKLKFMPEIVFKIDDSLDKARRVLDILDTLSKEKAAKEGTDETADRGDQEA